MIDAFDATEARAILTHHVRRIVLGAPPAAVAADVLTELRAGPESVLDAFVQGALELIAGAASGRPIRPDA